MSQPALCERDPATARYSNLTDRLSSHVCQEASALYKVSLVVAHRPPQYAGGSCRSVNIPKALVSALKQHYPEPKSQPLLIHFSTDQVIRGTHDTPVIS